MNHAHTFYLRWADASDADLVAALVQALLIELWQDTAVPSLDIDLTAFAHTARRWLEQGHYQALLAYRNGSPMGVTTVAQSHALYAGGPIGLIQEFFVARQARCQGLGGLMLRRVGELARRRGWHALELCSPPAPELAHTLPLFHHAGFVPTGGQVTRRRVLVSP